MKLPNRIMEMRAALLSCCRLNGVMADQEESLLQQLTEITRVMREGQLVEGMAAESKAQSGWEGESEAISLCVCASLKVSTSH